MDLKAVVLSVLFLFLCSEVSGYHKQKRQAQEVQLQNPFSWFQEKAGGYWEQVKNTTQDWVESFKILDFNVKVRETSERAAEALKTYATILYDQVYHSW